MCDLLLLLFPASLRRPAVATSLPSPPWAGFLRSSATKARQDEKQLPTYKVSHAAFFRRLRWCLLELPRLL